jgi:uncharacterized glyoxalase superfamily protein PhnB
MTHHDGAAPTLLDVYPCLTYRDLNRALTWLKAVFGLDNHALRTPGTAPEQRVEHALLRTPGGGTILVEAERPDELHGPHAGRGWIYVTVTDADAHYQQATAVGADTFGEPHDFGDAFRGYSARDLEGNLWTFGTAQP